MATRKKKADASPARSFAAEYLTFVAAGGDSELSVKDYTIQGWTMDVERLKKGHRLTDEFFDRRVELIREIRLSERRFSQKVTDLYATAFDYDRDASTTREFFAMVQNKLHWAVHRHTTAEVIVKRADAARPSMGLTSWEAAPSGRIVKSAVSVARQRHVFGHPPRRIPGGDGRIDPRVDRTGEAA